MSKDKKEEKEKKEKKGKKAAKKEDKALKADAKKKASSLHCDHCSNHCLLTHPKCKHGLKKAKKFGLA